MKTTGFNEDLCKVLECLESIANQYDINYDRDDERYTTIKNYLLKTQEPKNYLKWEALDLSDTPARVKIKSVRMNGNAYELKVFYSGGEKFALLTETSGQLCGTFREYNSKFFNDLRLETVEGE